MHKNHKTDWKKFEEFVSKIEELLSERAVRVKTNDSITDKYGNLRQVDASVRVSTGTSELLVIFECRKRKKMSDVTWIEQVASKRDNLRANLAVMVSTSAFTHPARVMAKDKGIQLRDLTPITNVGQLFMFPERMEMHKVIGHFTHLDVTFRSGTPAEVSEDFFHASAAGKPVEILKADGSSVVLLDAINAATASLKSPSLAPGQTTAKTSLVLVTPDDDARLRLSVTTAHVNRIVAWYEYRQEVIPSETQTGHYLTETGLVDHYVSRTEGEVEGQQVVFTAAGKRNSNSFRFHISPEFGTEDVKEATAASGGAMLEVFIGPDGRPSMRRVS